MHLSPDKAIVQKIQDCAAAGINRAHDVEVILQSFVQDLFHGKDLPSPLDRRYFPSCRDILNIIARFDHSQLKCYSFVHSTLSIDIGRRPLWLPLTRSVLASWWVNWRRDLDVGSSSVHTARMENNVNCFQHFFVCPFSHTSCRITLHVPIGRNEAPGQCLR